MPPAARPEDRSLGLGDAKYGTTEPYNHPQLWGGSPELPLNRIHQSYQASTPPDTGQTSPSPPTEVPQSPQILPLACRPRRHQTGWSWG